MDWFSCFKNYSRNPNIWTALQVISNLPRWTSAVHMKKWNVIFTVRYHWSDIVDIAFSQVNGRKGIYFMGYHFFFITLGSWLFSYCFWFVSRSSNCYRPQRSWGKVMFLQVSVILLTGGGTWPGTSPQTRYTPRDQVPPGPGTPSRNQVHPPQTRYPLPRTRYTPWDQVHPPGTRYPPRTRYPPTPGTPRDQVHPPGPDTPPEPGTPPRTRYTPLGPGTPPPGPGTPPLGPGTPPWTRYTPWPGTPPGTRYTPRTREIRSTRGRYASYWNAFLFYCKLRFVLLVENRVGHFTHKHPVISQNMAALWHLSSYVPMMFLELIVDLVMISFSKNYCKKSTSNFNKLQGMDITVYKPHPFSSHACAWEGVLEKPALFALYK